MKFKFIVNTEIFIEEKSVEKAKQKLMDNLEEYMSNTSTRCFSVGEEKVGE